MSLEKQLKRVIARQHKADSTGAAYWTWVLHFLKFVRNRDGRWVHPSSLGRTDVEQWLSAMASSGQVSPNTQNLAFSAVCYLYREVLGTPLENVSALRAKRPQRVRDIVDQSELVALFSELNGVALLAARMMYATGMRIGELGNIRIKDISFERRQIIVRDGKGAKDRPVGFPEVLHGHVRRQIESMRVLWKSDRSEGLNGVSLPFGFGKKSPGAHLEFAWWYLFASDHYSRDPKSQRMYRHHRDTAHVARQIKSAAIRSGISKRITSHCLRHSFATHSLESGVPVHFVQALMGHNDIRTTEGYLHATKDGVTKAESPLAKLLESAPERNPQPRIATTPKLRVFAG